MLYSAGSFVGYVGILSAVHPGVLSLSLNTRVMSHPILQLLDIYINALEQKGYCCIYCLLCSSSSFSLTKRRYSLVSFLSRAVVENATSFDEAIATLSSTKLIADVYYIVAEGSINGGGCVLARNQSGVVNVTCISPPSKWFVIETNYDCMKSLFSSSSSLSFLLMLHLRVGACSLVG